MYEWDTRIHLLARGPGIPHGQTFPLPATQVDMAPTFLALAGLQSPPEFDGKSLLPHIVQPSTLPSEALPDSVSMALQANEEGEETWRKGVFLQYYYVDDNNKCMDQVFVPPTHC